MASGAFMQVSVRVPREHAELVESLLASQGALAITLTDSGEQPLLEPGLGETPLWGEVTVTGLFEDHPDLAGLPGLLSLVPGVAEPPTLSRVAQRDWERAWLDRFRPMRFGQRLWIVPSGRQCPDENAVQLRLDPGLAFGTGTHATTRLCLEWLERQQLGGKTVIDYGCGSGVLGIAAALLGAAAVTCIDNDPQAITAARENAVRNNSLERIDTLLADQPPALQADCVVANILAGVLVALADPLQAMVAPGGSLALGGVLAGQADEVAAAYARRFPDLQRTTIDDWVLLWSVAGD